MANVTAKDPRKKQIVAAMRTHHNVSGGRVTTVKEDKRSKTFSAWVHDAPKGEHVTILTYAQCGFADDGYSEFVAERSEQSTDKVGDLIQDRNLPKSYQTILKLVFNARRNGKSRSPKVKVVDGAVQFRDAGPVTEQQLNNMVKDGWLKVVAQGVTDIVDEDGCVTDQTSLLSVVPGPLVVQETLAACVISARPNSNMRKDGQMPAKKTSAKKAPARKKKDYSSLSHDDFFHTNKKGKETFKPGYDAVLKSILIKIAKGDATKEEKALATSAKMKKHEKTQSPAFQALYGAL